ncbi:MAG: hypothetical protein HPY62_01860 [Bacteroidales bacterium]|nr:hypothetical protein [Bacteroidales bacterium]
MMIRNKYIKYLLHCLSGAGLILLMLMSLETKAFSQANPGEMIAGKLSKYCQSVPWEDIFIHSDRDEYVAGENIWINLFLIDRHSGKLNAGAKIAYIEILNSENRPVVQKRLELSAGRGHGNLELPDTLSTGVYLMRAYTNYMKNFMPENCFVKELTVYNALKSQSKPVQKYSVYRNISETDQDNYILKIDNKDSDSFRVTIRNTDLIKNKSSLWLLVQSRGNISLNREIDLTGEMSELSIPKTLLASGVNNIVLFSRDGKFLAESYFYNPLNQDKEIILKAEPFPDAGKREKVTLDLLPDTASMKSSAISISVSPSKGQNTNSMLEDYMIFGTEFGILPDQLIRKPLNEIETELIDKYLSGVKSRWIDWEKVMSDKLPALTYKSEDSDHYITGTLLDQSSQAGLPDKYVFLSVPGKIAQFRYSVTDRNGNFSFRIPVDTELRDLIIQPEETGTRSIIKLNSPFFEEYLPFDMAGDSIPATFPDIVSRMCVNYQVGKIYGIPSFTFPEDINNTSKKVKRFYGKPDIELVMRDFIKLPVMQEVFFELLPGVQMKSRKSGYEISIADPVEGSFYDKAPVLFVDGVVVNDASVIAGIDPELVERIDVVKERYLVGEYLFYGLINVITYAGDLSSITLPEYAVRIPYKVVEPQNVFYSPVYRTDEERNSRIPDFRNTLYWNPEVIPDNDGRIKAEFLTGDVPGNYIIDIQGINDDGTIISLRRNLKVN